MQVVNVRTHLIYNMGLLTIYHGRFEQKQGLSIRIRKEMIFIHAQEKEYTFHP